MLHYPVLSAVLLMLAAGAVCVVVYYLWWLLLIGAGLITVTVLLARLHADQHRD